MIFGANANASVPGKAYSLIRIMPHEAQASIKVDSRLRASARLWAIVRPAAAKP